MKTAILNSIAGLWNRLPLIARAVLSGCLVSTLGVFTWNAMLSTLPAPWVILPMIAALWIFWRFFSGKWGSTAGKQSRAKRFRSTSLSPLTWKWGLAAAVFFVIVIQSSFVVTFGVIDFPAAKFAADYKIVDTYPLWVAYLIIIMSSVTAAIVEEAGFRGYMQAPLEKRYGTAPAIFITSLVFTTIHLGHTWALPIWPHIFFASILLGVIAYKTCSLIPGIIGHAILDIFDYSFWWTDLNGGFQKQTIFKTGVDMHFMVWVLIFLFAIFGFFKIIERLSRSNKSSIADVYECAVVV